MRRTSLSVLTLLLLASGARAADKAPKPPPYAVAPSADTCAEVRGSARAEAYGYTHVVSLRNGCDRPVRCELWSDVDPEPRVRVEVAAGAATEVITRRGSPAREVVGHKKCSFR
jgi:hypothetical protein